MAENFSALVALWHAQLVSTISKPEIVEDESADCIFRWLPQWWAGPRLQNVGTALENIAKIWRLPS